MHVHVHEMLVHHHGTYVHEMLVHHHGTYVHEMLVHHHGTYVHDHELYFHEYDRVCVSVSVRVDGCVAGWMTVTDSLTGCLWLSV